MKEYKTHILDITDNAEIKKYYKETDKIRKYMCFVWSNYFNLGYEDLYSEANLIFVNSIYSYTHQQKTFIDFYKNTLYDNLKNYCYNQMKQRTKEQKLKDKLFNEYIIIENTIRTPNELELKQDKDIKKIINQIINFVLRPDYMAKLKPFIKIKKQKKIKCSAYLIKYYFNCKYGYPHYKLNEAISGIREMLKEGMI